MLKNLLSNCWFFEKLSLYFCQHLVKLKIDDRSRQLKLLNIKDCLRLKEIKVSSENLIRLEYIGPLISFFFKCVDKLTEVYRSFTQNNRIGAATYALTKLAMDLPHLEKLNLLSILSMKALELPDNWLVFTNVKRLFLTVYPFDDEDKLSWVLYILGAFPQLQKLQLNLFSPSFIKQPKEIERLLPGCPQNHLKELEINGFNGNRMKLSSYPICLRMRFHSEDSLLEQARKSLKALTTGTMKKQAHITNQEGRPSLIGFMMLFLIIFFKKLSRLKIAFPVATQNQFLL